MYKAFWVVALLVAMLTLTGRNSTAAEGTFASPLIVVRKSLQNQTAIIPDTVLYTPNRDGFYRLSFYMVMTRIGTRGQSWLPYLHYTDESAPQTFQLNSEPDSGGFVDSYTLPFRAVAGSPIGFSVSSTGSANGTYEVVPDD